MLEFIIVNYLYRKGHHYSRPQSGDGVHTVRGEVDVTSPLVAGEDPVSGESQGNHRPAKQLTAVMTGFGSRPASAAASDDRARAAASVFAWLRRPNIFQPQREQHTSQARLARAIDHVSKTVFPFLFGVFSFTFFAVFAGYLPSLLDEWIANEYRAEEQ